MLIILIYLNLILQAGIWSIVTKKDTNTAHI